jgi:hypothetical protein
MTGRDSCGGPPLDASKDQTEGEPQLDSLLDGADSAAVEAGHAGAADFILLKKSTRFFYKKFCSFLNSHRRKPLENAIKQTNRGRTDIEIFVDLF